MSSFNAKELDFSLSQTVARSEVALTLSQCRGFNLVFPPSVSSPSSHSEELPPLVTSLIGFDVDVDLGFRI